jgi:hypothetical protein
MHAPRSRKLRALVRRCRERGSHIALCGGLACSPELASDLDDDSFRAAALTRRTPLLDADAR